MATSAGNLSIIAGMSRFCLKKTIRRKIGLLSHLSETSYDINQQTQRNYSDIMRSPPCLRDELICDVVEPIQDNHSKVTVVGAGTVGISICNSILFQKISSHVALVDAFPKKLQGEGMDFTHGLSFIDGPRFEFDTDLCITSNSRVVIIAAGAKQCKDEARSDMVQRNADILKCIITPLAEYSPKAVFLIVTNPVDVLSWFVWKISGLPVNRVIGVGTHLDTARFRYMISNRIGVAQKSIHGFIIGEHGDTQVPLWSGVNVAGVQFRDILPNIGMTTDEEKWHEVFKEVVAAAPMVRCLKGYTSTAVGLAVADIVKDILQNAQSVKAVSTLAQGHYGICQEIFLSLPCLIGENGINSVIRVRMTESERKLLLTSADAVYNNQKEIVL